MKKKLCVLVSALLCAAALYGCGNTASTPKEKVYVDASEIANVYSAPKDYVGKYIQLTGKVFTEVDKGNSSISFQMFQDPENSERNTVITCSDTSLSVKNGDYIKVDGMIKGTFEGTNAYGGSVNALSISADTVTVASYAEIMAPALKTIELTNAVKDQHQCSVQITKVEIAEKETRVYVTAKNGSDKDMSCYRGPSRSRNKITIRQTTKRCSPLSCPAWSPAASCVLARWTLQRISRSISKLITIITASILILISSTFPCSNKDTF